MHINFTNKKLFTEYLSVRLIENIVPYENNKKYPGMTLDVKLRWKEYKEEQN